MYRKTKYGQMTHTYPVTESHDKLITGYQGLSELNMKDGNVHDTVLRCNQIVQKHHSQVTNLASFLKAPTLLQSCYNIWHFCTNNINYHHDTYGKEELRTPARSWNDRMHGIDCDDFAIFVASLLKEMNYNYCFYTVSFDGIKHTHIYIGAGNCQITDNKPDANVLIDPVEKTFFFSTVPVKKTKIYKPKNMKIETLSDIDRTTAINSIVGSPIADATSIRLIETRKKTKNKKAISKIDMLLSYNGTLYRDALLFASPYIDEVLPDGRLAIRGDELATLIQSLLSETDKIIEDSISNLSDDEFDEIFMSDGLGALGKGFFAKVKDKIKNAANKAADGIKNAAKKTWHGIKKVTIAVPRNAFLLLVKFNVFGLATKLYIGKLTEAQAKTKNLDISAWNKAKTSYEKTKKFFVKCGGEAKNIDKAITSSWKKKPLLGGKKTKTIQELLLKIMPEELTAFEKAQAKKEAADKAFAKLSPEEQAAKRKYWKSKRLSGLGFAAAATATTATPFLAKVVVFLKNIPFEKLFKKIGEIIPSKEDKDEYPEMPESYTDTDGEEYDYKTKSVSTDNKMLPILIGAGAIGLLLLMKK